MKKLIVWESDNKKYNKKMIAENTQEYKINVFTWPLTKIYLFSEYQLH
jgi:hypothetical protein